NIMKTHLLFSLKTTAIIFLFFLVQTAAAQDATALYQEGIKLKNEKKSKDAVEKFKLAIAQKPSYTEALYEWGWCQNDLKDYTGAITNLRTVRKTWGNIPKVHFELGYAFEKTSQYDSAIQSYNECLRLKPDYSLGNKQLGYIAYNREDNKAALEHFAKYEANAKDEIKDYLYWYRKGFLQNAQKEYTGAIVSLKKSLDYKTDYTNTYLELGFASNKLKLAEDAISYYKKAMELDPKSHIPYNGIGEVYRDTKKDMNEAMAWYQKTLGINSKERKACFGMGYCLNSQARYIEAMNYLKTAIEQEPTYTAAFVEFGYSNYMLAKYTEAIEQFNKALSLNPANENARYYSCQVYIKQRNKTMAQKMVDELKRLNSKHVATLQPKVDAL
ncbi:MAG TPA: tetratricopeptide repeat protein, partial [Chitinophagaceae bacterium]|nr:tetratricopeptide repeat protein [Chitinophagaceae bacterium]